MTRLVLGVDCSTTACKAVLWGPDGAAHGEGRAPIGLLNPAPDAWEQDPRRYVEALTEATRAALAAAGPDAAGRLDAMCVTHQRETVVFVDDAGEPLAPAIVWMDARGAAEVEAARRAIGEARLHELSGKVPCTTPSMYKIMAALGRDAGLRAARPRALDVHAFLTEALTGERVTSVASADPMGLVDMRSRAWAPELVELAGLSIDRLPRLVDPGELAGRLRHDVASSMGLPAGLPVVAGAGDGQAAGLGAGVLSPGRAYLNLGTALVAGVPSATYALARAFRTLTAAYPGGYLLETDLLGGTFSVNWFVERLLGVPQADAAAAIARLDRDARAVPPGASGLLMLPYLCGVMNPYWRPDASGALVGLRGDHGPAEVFRAIVEGLALEQRLHLEGVEAATERAIDELVVMGGGSTSDLFCQIVADATGKRVTRSRTSEASCLGAGVLAATHAGWRSGPDAIGACASAMTGTGASFEPGAARSIYDRLAGVHRGLYPALASSLSALAALRRAGE